LIYCRFPLVDASGNEEVQLTLAVSTLTKLLENRISTLVICSGGISRSPAIASAALALVLKSSLAEAIAKIIPHHPVDISPGLWRDLEMLLEKER